MNYILLAVMSMPAVFQGEFTDLASCQNAIHEIYATKMNPPNQRLPEIEEAVKQQLKVQRSFICVPKQKG
jgi:hypothetical protein